MAPGKTIASGLDLALSTIQGWTKGFYELLPNLIVGIGFLFVAWVMPVRFIRRFRFSLKQQAPRAESRVIFSSRVSARRLTISPDLYLPFTVTLTNRGY